MASLLDEPVQDFSNAGSEACKKCRYLVEEVVMPSRREGETSRREVEHVGYCAKVKIMRVVDPATVRPTPSPAFITPQNIVFNPHPPCANRVREDGSCGFEPLPLGRRVARIFGFG